jgi:phospholipid transport system transporter-binding protein
VKPQPREAASFEVLGGERSRIIGGIEFATVTALLPVGRDAILAGQASVIDLSGVTGADSAGLALLIEWLSIAKDARRAVSYENVPSQVHQLADLSDVEEMIAPA